ncbi:iron(III) transport system permease protein [Limimonas halophila]|uniref:Iron(III) transport system permease protein n=1 Tax=Limimonas halophila TaxID=1082479 RepID=A0A1G7M2A8_9PROT|nr:iron ABC transporter permease [Limimonas halophila]SDF55945.1 iron(III) transport system permease protein [Limimonas halophila]
MTESTFDSSWAAGEPADLSQVPQRRGGRSRGSRATAVLGWASVLIAAVLSIPVITVVAQLVLPTDSEVWGHLVQTVLPRYLLNTLWLVLGVGIGAPVIGTLTAWLVTMYRFPGRPIFEWALILPLAVPAYVMAYAYTDFLQVTGPVQTALRTLFELEAGAMWFPQVRSLPGAIAMMTFVLYPYVYLLARASFLEQSVCALEVGRTLGYGPWRNFLRVALPLARPSIAGGTALVLMEALSDFGTVSYFGVQTFTTGIVRVWSSFGDPVAASQLAALLLAVVFAVLLLERLSRGRARYHHTSARYRRLPRTTLSPGKQALATLACALPILAGFLLPAGILLGMAITAAQRSYSLNFLEMAGNSFSLAAVTAVLAVVLATVMVYGRRLRPGRASLLANRVAGLGYAVPGTVIAIGVLVPFTAAENAVDAWLRANLGVSTGLLLTGTIAALVFAYLVRFLAVALNTMEASLARVRPTMEDAARTLGHGPTSTLLRVHAPLVSGSMLTAGLLVFVDVLKELPATLVLRPFNYDTLAVQAFNLASDERLTEAATPALTIVAVGILPVIILSKTIARSRPGA